MRNNQISYIKVPSFANLEMGEKAYSVHITLPVTLEVANYIKDYIEKKKSLSLSTFFWGNRWYVRVDRLYTYATPISEALYNDAYCNLKYLKILIRKAKISILESQIHSLRAEERSFR